MAEITEHLPKHIFTIMRELPHYICAGGAMSSYFSGQSFGDVDLFSLENNTTGAAINHDKFMESFGFTLVSATNWGTSDCHYFANCSMVKYNFVASTYKNKNGEVVQLISPANTNGNKKLEVLDVLESFDFTHCKIALNHEKQIISAPGAERLSSERKLELAENFLPATRMRTLNRFVKYVKRGFWYNEEDFELLLENYNYHENLFGEEPPTDPEGLFRYKLNKLIGLKLGHPVQIMLGISPGKPE